MRKKMKSDAMPTNQYVIKGYMKFMAGVCGTGLLLTGGSTAGGSIGQDLR